MVCPRQPPLVRSGVVVGVELFPIAGPRFGRRKAGIPCRPGPCEQVKGEHVRGAIMDDAVRNLLIDALLAEFRQDFATPDESASCAYRNDLESKRTDELHDLWESGTRKRALAERKRELAEIQQKKEAAAKRFVDVADSWAKKPYWKRLEAVALLLALDPNDSIHLHRSQSYLSVDSSLTEEAENLEDLLTRATVAKELPELLKPAALLAWLERKAIHVPHDLKSAVERYAPPRPAETPAPTPKAEPVDDGASDPEPITKGSITARRVQAILIAVAAKGWDAMSIPTGGKAETKRICLTQPDLFTPSTFDTAWDNALKEGKLRTERHDTYAKRE